MRRFVLLYHDCPPQHERASHWDLMLEADGVLRTWALGELPNCWKACHARTRETQADCPPLADSDCVSAEQLGDHRLAYLETEGPLGGCRGRVTRIDGGAYHGEAEAEGCWDAAIDGERCGGRITLRRSGPETRQWSLSVEVPRG
jgi:hypothetical protein